jgi:aryl-phospho-beta-D-glucosidase BglC (GH1 family)
MKMVFKKILLLECLISALFLGFACSSTTSSTSMSDPRNFTPVGGVTPVHETILSFTVSSPGARGIVNRFDHTIKLYLFGVSVTSITPIVVLADGITITSPVSAVIDLSSPVIYTLSDGSTYVVSAIISADPSAATVNSWLGTGINLGNELDAWPGNEGSWTDGVVAQKYMFDDFKAMGFNSVRIPVTWGEATNPSDRLSDVFPYNVNPSFMTRVDTVAGWGIDAGLTIVINAHHEDWIRTKTGADYTVQKQRFIALWTQIAEHFKSWPPQLVFEIINEPWKDMTNEDVNDLNTAVLAVIRANNPTRTVIMGANSWNSIDAMQDGVFTVPTHSSDPHIIANFHYYKPYSFCGYSKGTWGSNDDIASMTGALTSAASWASSKGVPVCMNECGVTIVYNGAITDTASRISWCRNVSRVAKSKGIPIAIWNHQLAFDKKNIWGDLKVYDLVDRTCDKDIIDAVMGN